MSATNEITLAMVLDHLQYVQKQMTALHSATPENRMTHYTKAHHDNCNKTLIRLVTSAIQNKRTGGPTLVQLLNQHHEQTNNQQTGTGS